MDVTSKINTHRVHIPFFIKKKQQQGWSDDILLMLYL